MPWTLDCVRGIFTSTSKSHMLPEHIQAWVNKSHTFTDGNMVTVSEIKYKDEGQYQLTYLFYSGPGIPVKRTMEFQEFVATYGHLFGK